ncbi:MAG TPA: ankyrin repeat domain-containing protein [Pyrinomonadaceae bacterium]|jgi:cytohesin
MLKVQRFVFAGLCVLSFVFLFSVSTNAQAMPVYLYLETVDSNQKPIADARVDAVHPDLMQRNTKQTDEKGAAVFEYMMRLPAFSTFKISKPGYYPFDLFGLVRATFYDGEWTNYGYREKLTVELLKIPQNKAERKILGNEQTKRDFFSAVLAGDAAKVRRFLKSGIDPNISTDDLRGVPRPNGVPAMLYAADNADIETMNEFLAAKVNLRKENSKIRNVLAYYIGSLNPIKTDDNIPYEQRVKSFNEYIDTLIKAGASLDAVNSQGQTLLTVALRRNSVELVKKLIDRGVPVNAKNKSGSTVLAEMFDSAYYPEIDDWKGEIIKLLLKSGANPNTTNETNYDCNSPLMYSAKYGQIDFVKLLLSYKADVNLKCKSGDTALSLLSWNNTPNYAELLNLLIEAGADVNAAGESGITPLMAAVESGNISVVKMLLKKGAAVNAQDKFGRTALVFAVQGIFGKPDIEIVDLLLKSGADPNLTTNGTSYESFGTALAAAVWHEPLYCIYRWKSPDCGYRDNLQYASEDIVKLLLANKADVNLTFQNKDTPLIGAAKGGRTGAVKLLIEAGADVKGEQGGRAIKAAKEKMQYAKDKSQYEEVIKLLEAAGAKD